MKLYQAFDVDEETPVQWLAVHPLRWNTQKWGEPAIMFREADDETQTLADAAPDLLAACEAQQKAIAVLSRALKGEGGTLSLAERLIYQTAFIKTQAALAIVRMKGDQCPTTE